MINEDFYPTPGYVIDKMLKPLSGSVGSYRGLPFNQILEPSAGKGDIADYIQKYYGVRDKRIFCIEREPELQLVLSGKGYPIIDSDFLSYSDRYIFDLIVMNPPFSSGDAHLLKAWDVVADGGHIVCLLNAETVLNPYTEKRKLLARIIEQHGSYEEVGPVFKNAERPTDVNCVIVRLQKPEKETVVDFDGDGMEFDAPVHEAEFSANPLAHPSIIKSLVAQYQAASKLLIQRYEIDAQYRFYTKAVNRKDPYSTANGEKNEADRTLNEQINDLKKLFWRYIFDKTNLGQKTTSNFQNKFESFTSQTSQMAFSEANIMQVLEMFFLNHDQIMQECILEVFDKATAFHEKNVIHHEGWKTNKSWRIAPKIILPWGIEFGSLGMWLSWGSRARDFYRDIDKVLCFLTSRSVTDITTIEEAIEKRIEAVRRGERAYDEIIHSTFFDIRVYKKGTVHLKFNDLDLLARFNQAAAQGKKWVGAGY